MTLLLTLALADDDAAARYAAEHLERVDSVQELPEEAAGDEEEPTLHFAPTSASYLIVDGQGERLQTSEVLLRAGYADEAAIVAREARKRRRTALLLAAAGGAAWAGGVGLLELGSDEDTAPGISLSLAGTGLLLGAVYPTFQRRALVHPDAVWSAEEADRFVEEANDRLREELGLTASGEPL